jgi:hypothetical protein
MGRRFDGDDGAVLTEAALVLPILVVFLVGAFDFGMGWRQSGYHGSAVGGGLRQLATNGSNRQADLFALQSYMATMSGTKNTTPVKVVVFRSNSTGQPTSATCLTNATSATGAGIIGACNIYQLSQLQNLTTANFGTALDTVCTGKWDQYWCPVGRNDLQGDPPDFIGIYSQVTYTSFTRMWGSSFTLTDRAVMQIEPKVS